MNSSRLSERLHGPNDCSAHARSYWLFGRATAVPPKHAAPTVVCACKGSVLPVTLGSPARAQASVSRPAALYPNLYPPITLYPPSAGRDWSSLGVGQGIGAGGVEKHEDTVRLDQLFRSIDRENNSGFRSSRAQHYATKYASLWVGPRLETHNVQQDGWFRC